MLHGHGDDGYRYGAPVRANFSSNTWPGVDHTALQRHLHARFAAVRSYPEPGAETLAGQIAQREGIDPAEVVVTNGATEAIYLIAQAHRGRRAAVVAPTFSEYADACALAGIAVRHIDRDEFFAGAWGDADLVWLCNPNNPTGDVFSRKALLGLIARHPQVRFVIDLAYAAFCAEEPLRASDVRAHSNLLVVHSLTKRFAIPGLRLGYLVTDAAVAATVARFRPPWSVNALALEAGCFLLAHQTSLAPLAPFLAETRRLMSALNQLNGLAVRPSATGFFLIELGRGRSDELKRDLLHHHGLLVRDAANFHGLDARHVRIATQTPPENRWLEEALDQWTRS